VIGEAADAIFCSGEAAAAESGVTAPTNSATRGAPPLPAILPRSTGAARATTHCSFEL
jgi:hypothetical protein